MIWVGIIVALMAWLLGLVLAIGPVVNLLLVVAGVLLAIAVIRERDAPGGTDRDA